MTKEMEKAYKEMIKNGIEKFFDIYDGYKNGFYPSDIKNEKYQEAMLEVANVMMLKTLKELED